MRTIIGRFANEGGAEDESREPPELYRNIIRLQSNFLLSAKSMSADAQVVVKEDDVLSAGVLDSEGRYFLWQRGLSQETGANDDVYFEFDDQINGGYNIAKKVVVSPQGIEVTLRSGARVNISYSIAFMKHAELKAGLHEIYQDYEHLLELRN